MNTRLISRLLIALGTCLGLFSLFVPAVGFAATLASDKASDPAYSSGGWTNGSNGGVGWGANSWQLFVADVQTDISAATFISSSTNNNANGDTNGDLDIDTTGVAWGTLGAGQDVGAIRFFNGSLTNGQRFVVYMDNGFVPAGQFVGFYLHNTNLDTRLQFLATNQTYVLQGVETGIAATNTGIANTDEGLKIEVQVVNVDTVNVFVTKLVTGTQSVFSNIALGAVLGGNTHEIGGVSFINSGAGGGATNQVFFNSIQILPNPTDASLFADLAINKTVSPNPAIAGSSLTYTVTVTNNGPADATAVTLTDVPPAGITFVTTPSQGTCTNIGGQIICDLGNLASSGIASVTVVGTSSSIGTITNAAVVTALNVDPNPTNNIITNIVNVVTAAQLSVSPANQDFGDFEIGTTATATFVVTNLGGATLIGSATVAVVQFAVSSGSPFSIPGFGTTNVDVDFTPDSAAAFTDNVIFASNGGVSTNRVTGTGSIPPLLAVTPASLGFGTLAVGDTSTLSFSVINNGIDTLSGTSTVSGTSFGPLSASPFSVLGGQTGTVDVTFSPGTAGAFTGSVAFTSNGGDLTNVITGAATNVIAATPLLVVTPASRSFGTLAVGQIGTQSFSVINGGLGTLNGTSTVSGTSFALLSGSPFSLAAGLTSTVVVTFSPASAATFTGSVVFTSNGGVSTNATTGAATNSAAAPVAAFTASPTNGAAQLIVSFTDHSTGTITNRLWNFGDGNISSSVSPTHVYTNAGSFTVSLTVRGPGGSNAVTHLVTVTGIAKNAVVGDWQITVSGADKGIGFLTFSNNATATGYEIRLGKFGLDTVSGTWGNDTKGKLTGTFIEKLGSATNWTGTLAGTAKTDKTLSAQVLTTSDGIFRWKGVPATTLPDLSGTWSGQVTVAKAASSNIAYKITINTTNAGVFDVAATTATNTVIGQFIVTSKDVVAGWLHISTNQTTLAGKGKLNGPKAPTITFKGTDPSFDKIDLKLIKE